MPHIACLPCGLPGAYWFQGQIINLSPLFHLDSPRARPSYFEYLNSQLYDLHVLYEELGCGTGLWPVRTEIRKGRSEEQRSWPVSSRPRLCNRRAWTWHTNEPPGATTRWSNRSSVPAGFVACGTTRRAQPPGEGGQCCPHDAAVRIDAIYLPEMLPRTAELPRPGDPWPRQTQQTHMTNHITNRETPPLACECNQ